MSYLNTNEIADALYEIGRRLELAGETLYKARAYYRAAENLRTTMEPLDRLVAENRLREIPGVGSAIEAAIQTLHRTGSHPTLERLRESAPEGLLELLDIPGLTSEKIMRIYNDLGIQSLEGLEEAANDGRIASAKGFGPRAQDKILDSIRLMREAEGRMHLHTATDRLAALCTRLGEMYPHAEFFPAGDVRRSMETVKDLAIVARNPTVDGIKHSEAGGIRLIEANPDRFGVAMLYATGPQDHVRQLTDIAEKHGLQLREDGLFRDTELVPCSTEEDVYRKLGLQYVVPELRDTPRWLDADRNNNLPRLITSADMRGVLHCHTDYSDGNNTLEEMAEAARKHGFEYFGVADHSQLAAYAGGLKPDRVWQQHKLADELNKRYAGSGFRILKGTECDILADGHLDFDDSILATFDYVVASVHSRFSLDEEAQTERIVHAVSNPYVTVLGHMTGRMLLSRDSYRVDIEAVLKACAANGVAVEINASPYRLDLDWRWHTRALELGCMLSINPDAHSRAEIDRIQWGVAVARKGGVPPERVLNCMGLAEITEYLSKRRAMKLEITANNKLIDAA